MAGEIQFSFIHGDTTYVLIRNTTGQIWSNVTSTFQNYNTSNYSGYTVTANEQGTFSAYYTANMPTSVPPGSYNIVAKNQLGTNPAETDPTIDAGSVEWNGGAVAPISSIPVSGTPLQVNLQRGTMVQNYEFYLRSSADHLTAFVSGTVSGQISRDGGAFTFLQSGAFTEVGLGFYAVTLTSGDLNANTVGLLFTANGPNGGASDPLPQTFILQRSSGS